MPIDPNIALQVKPLQLNDPLAQYAQVSQIQNAQNQNALAQYQLESAQRENEYEKGVQNYFATKPDLTSPNAQAELARFGKTGLGYGKLISEQQTNAMQREKLANEIQKQQQDYENEVAKDLIANPSRENIIAHGQKLVINKRATPEQAQTKIDQYLAMEPTALRTYLIEKQTPAKDLMAAYMSKPIEKTDGQTKWMEEGNSKLPTFGQRIAAAPVIQMKAAPTSTGLNKLIQERDALPPGSPLKPVYDAAIAKQATHQPPNIVTVNQRLEGAEQKGKGELNVKQYGDLTAQATIARKLLPSLDIQAKILDSGFKTGFGTDAKTAAASVLGSLGVQNAKDYAANSQIFLAQGRQALLQKQLEQKGAQSEGDAQRMEQTFTQLGNTTKANRFLIDAAKVQAKRTIDQQKFYDNWWTKNKTYEGAENAWVSGEGSKSIFDSPELKNYVTPAKTQTPAAGAGVTVRNW